MKLENKVALITGGTGALGRAVTKRFLEAGAHVTTTYTREEGVARLLAILGEHQTRLTGLKTDVTKEEEVKQSVDSLAQKFGRIDVLVNLAGGYVGGAPIAELDEKTWDFMMNLNLKSAFLCSKHVLPYMIAQKQGRIINISSRAAVRAFSGIAAYAASKAGIIAFTKVLAAETREHGITANVILPSIIDTEANRASMPKANFDAWVKPEELANVILFLASDEAREISGAAIPVYGRA